jgi:GAF domain-containing protein
MMGNPREQTTDELRRLADEQAALRRVATLVARGAPSTAVFTTVAEEVGALFGADATAIIRFEPDDEATLLAARGQTRRETGTRFTPDPRLAIASVRATSRAARIEANDPTQASVPDILGTPGIRSVVDVPIVVEGRVWGAIGVAARRGPLPPDIEQRLTDFAELVATAIANAQARDELRQVADELRRVTDEQTALRRVATLVARAEPPAALFSAVAEEVGALFGADATAIIRFEPYDEATLLAARGQTRRETGTRFTPDPLAIASVRATSRAARIEANGPTQASVPDILGTPGIRSVVDVPIVVEGRV